jgi:hypothetical protein
MAVLSCQTPQMNEKQLWVHLLAHNVIRLLMAQAAAKAAGTCLAIKTPKGSGSLTPLKA